MYNIKIAKICFNLFSGNECEKLAPKYAKGTENIAINIKLIILT